MYIVERVLGQADPEKGGWTAVGRTEIGCLILVTCAVQSPLIALATREEDRSEVVDYKMVYMAETE